MRKNNMFKTKKKYDKRLNLLIDAATLDRLESISRKHEVSVSKVVRDILRGYFKTQASVMKDLEMVMGDDFKL